MNRYHLVASFDDDKVRRLHAIGDNVTISTTSPRQRWARGLPGIITAIHDDGTADVRINGGPAAWPVDIDHLNFTPDHPEHR